MAMIRMIDNPPLLHESFHSKFEIKNEPSQVRSMILEENIDFAIVPSTMGALLYNKTGKYILAAIPVWGTLYLFGRDTAIHEWHDLKGKKVSLMARGMTPDVMFRYLAEKNGLDPEKDMKLDYSFPTHIELANAIASGVADLGVLSEPLTSLVMQNNPEVKPILNFDKEWNELFDGRVPFAQTALLVKKELAEQHPEIVDSYLEELEYSIDWVNQNPDSAAALIQKHAILPDSAVAYDAIPRSNLHFLEAGKEKKGIEQYFKVFYNFNPLIIGGELPNETFYYQKKDY